MGKLAFEEFTEGHPLPRTATWTVIAQDPSVRLDGAILTTRAQVPAEFLAAGPRGARFHVVDYDPATGTLEPQAELGEGDRFEGAGDGILTEDPVFRAQNVYATAARTLAAFESGLGRRLPWAFRGHQLYLVPRAFPEANAYYSGDEGAIYFGYEDSGDGGRKQACLSHDIVAHETTHAVLDGLRPRLVEPGLPDQAAFHEGFADIVALLSVFSIREVVERLLGPAHRRGRIPKDALSREVLSESALFVLAEEMGTGAGSARGSGLRRSVGLTADAHRLDDPAFSEPHRRGEILVAAVMQTLVSMWTARLEAITDAEGADRSRVAEEGMKAAEHLLRMMIRGLDYMPPVELEFADVVDSVLKADEVLAPDDAHGYRTALAEAFASFGIERPRREIVDLSGRPSPVYDRMNYEILRADTDEVFRFIWENAEVFEIDRRWRLHVDAVRPSVRVGPDGLVVAEVVADYLQTLELSAEEFAEYAGELPVGLDPKTPLQVFGGGVLIFDQFGRAKLHQTKPLTDWDRQLLRLRHLVDQGLRDSSGRIGFSLGLPRGQRFALMHVPDRRVEEDW